jgi:hypothetical protein
MEHHLTLNISSLGTTDKILLTVSEGSGGLICVHGERKDPYSLTDEKENEIFLTYKEIQMGSGTEYTE